MVENKTTDNANTDNIFIIWLKKYERMKTDKIWILQIFPRINEPGREWGHKRELTMKVKKINFDMKKMCAITDILVPTVSVH